MVRAPINALVNMPTAQAAAENGAPLEAQIKALRDAHILLRKKIADVRQDRALIARQLSHLRDSAVRRAPPPSARRSPWWRKRPTGWGGMLPHVLRFRMHRKTTSQQV